MTDATKAEPIGYVYSHGSVKVGTINQHDIPNGTPLYTHPQPILSARMKEMESVAFEDWLSDRYPTGNVEEIQLQWLQSSEHDDMINEFEELQRLTEAGEIQAALERIAELEAALRMASQYLVDCSGFVGNEYHPSWHRDRPEHTEAIEAARAALAGEAKAAPRLTDAEVIALRSEFGWAKDTIRAIEAKVRGTP